MAIKRRPVGRPRALKSPKQLLRRAEAYFKQCVENDEPFLITALALAVGLCSRLSLIEYGERPEFTNTVKAIKARVEADYERRLASNTPAGAIFALKNMGWSDRQDVTHSGPGGGPIEAALKVTFVKPSPDAQS